MDEESEEVIDQGETENQKDEDRPPAHVEDIAGNQQDRYAQLDGARPVECDYYWQEERVSQRIEKHLKPGRTCNLGVPKLVNNTWDRLFGP